MLQLVIFLFAILSVHAYKPSNTEEYFPRMYDCSGLGTLEEYYSTLPDEYNKYLDFLEENSFYPFNDSTESDSTDSSNSSFYSPDESATMKTVVMLSEYTPEDEDFSKAYITDREGLKLNYPVEFQQNCVFPFNNVDLGFCLHPSDPDAEEIRQFNEFMNTLETFMNDFEIYYDNLDNKFTEVVV